MSLQLSTRRSCSFAAHGHDDGLGRSVIFTASAADVQDERFVLDKSEAVALAEELLRAAGVKFKITVNA